ncbi:MAG: hypothetical protein QM741_13410 [Rudaea sp.]|uniref:hypothetical protein n=1 Tax=Rudaea sp. TaxID=2136325 RepID=UPI0039E5A3A4
MTRRKHRSSGGEAHVRLYRHELDCAAYRTLGAGARVLLVEMRALFNPKNGDNRIFMGVRDMMTRCNLTQRVATRARDELLERGWISLVEQGSFHRKLKHATVYALENEAPNDRKGSVPSKAFMRWQPDPSTKKHGSGIDYRSVAESTTDAHKKGQKRAVSVAESTTDKADFRPLSVAESTTQIAVTKRAGVSCAAAESFFWSAATPGISNKAQLILLAGGLVASANKSTTRKAA